jgi:signal transduction histidine kinase
MKAINDSARNMERAVHGILDFAKPIQCHPTDQDVGNLVDNVLELCRPKAEEDGVILKKDVFEPVMVPLDAFFMERALTNLVINAIEASSKNQEVVVNVLHGSEAAVVVVTDHGHGMDEETLANIFTPFYSKKSTGTGLGMAIAKKIIEEHEGGIAITSERGVGTEITITLPKVLPDKAQVR